MLKNYILIAIATAFFANYIWDVLNVLGFTRTIPSTVHTECHVVEGPEDFRNCEDFVLSPTEPGIAYTACDPARDYQNMVMDIHRPMPHPQPGYIWRIDYTKNSVKRMFTLDGDEDFHPLGLVLVNPTLLMVINLRHHNPASIELFSLPDAKHIRTLTHPQISSPNSLHILKGHSAADGTPSFFYTNDHYFITGIKKKLENFLRIPLGTIMFYDAPSHRAYAVARGFSFANGLAGDNKQVLFAAETNKMTVHRYDIITIPAEDDHDTKVQLHYVDKVTVPMAVDNIDFDSQSGDVTIAGHPKAWNLLKYVEAPEKNVKKLPSRVMVWHTNTNQVEDLFLDDGTFYRTSSTGAIDNNTHKLIISGLYARGILVCNHDP
ncbi:hypothetical protein BDC45DRAFT_526068 [Circinella umbellata]|nr:hypothetical protein BDC45DRAFT_526068 [Circinella umbellata]